MLRLFPYATVVTALIGSGIVHGLWTDRWTVSQDPLVAAARLEHISLVLGDWQGQVLEVNARDLGPVAGCCYRHYVNRRDGGAVTVFLVCGAPGPISIHTPDVCYQASGYEVEPAIHYPFGSPPADFFTTQMVKKRSAEQTHLRIFWSWSAGGTWSVPESPRLAFANCPVLYKLYLIRETGGPGEVRDGDPCVKFMEQFLPELQKTLFQ